MRAGVTTALILSVFAGVGMAEAPATSILPQPRPSNQAVTPLAPDTGSVATNALPHPKPRMVTPATDAPATGQTTGATVRPKLRPEGLALASTKAAATVQPKQSQPAKKGSVCGDPSIKGVALAPITSRTRGCGLADGVKITSVAGVALNPAASVDCATAKALKTWVERGLQPAFAPASVVELRIFASYICRTRNNARGAKISEHGRGKAVDVGAFVLDNGKTITVASDYNKQVRKAQKAACGIFGTTLGPGSDGYHEDHLHFDTAEYRSGPYCR